MAISPISPTGRALQGEIQNLPQDQAMQRIMQSMGQVPLSELLSMKMQLDRLKQPQGQIPQTTVAQDIEKQMGAMSQGVGGMPVPDQMFNQSPQGYAHGGIVGYARGGGVGPPKYLRPPREDEIISPEEIVNRFKNTRERVPKYIDASKGEIMDPLEFLKQYDANPTNSVLRGNPGGVGDISTYRPPAPPTANLPVPAGPLDNGHRPNWQYYDAANGEAAAGERMMNMERAGGIASKAGRLATAAFSYPAAVGITGVLDAVNPVSTEDMAAYSGIDPNAPPEGTMARSYRPLTPVEERLQQEAAAGYDKWAQEHPGLAQFSQDVAARAPGSVLRALSLGMLGPQGGEDAAAAPAGLAALAPTPPDTPAGPPLPELKPNDPLAGVGVRYGGSGSGSADLSMLDKLQKDAYAASQKTPDRATAEAEANADYEKAGIGKSADERAKILADRKSGSEGERKLDRRLALAAAGFKMAEAASRPGATFLGSAAEGGTEGAKGYKEAEAEYRKSQQQVEDAQYDLDKTKEQIALGKISRKDSLYDKQLDAVEKARQQATTAASAKAQIEASQLEAKMRAQAMMLSKTSAMSDPARVAGLRSQAAYQAWREAEAKGDPRVAEYEKRYQQEQQRFEEAAGARTADSTALRSLKMQADLIKMQSEDPSLTQDQRKALVAQYADIQKQLAGGSSVGSAGSAGGVINWDSLGK